MRSLNSKIAVHLLMSISLVSCFKEDEKIFPPPPGDETLYSFEKSIYDYQSYFDFSGDTCVAVIPNDSWQIEFGTDPASWEVRINSAAYYGVYPTGDSAFNGITRITDPLKYVFDMSDGNPDSCAFASWLNKTDKPYYPTGEVFLIGENDGFKTIPKWKIRIDSYSDTSFTFTYATFPSGNPVKTEIFKDTRFSYVQYDLKANTQSFSQPQKTGYDLLFTQYGTILYDDNGTPTPYYVRGILLNPFNTEASLDTLHSFEEITYETIKDYQFSSRRDVIGHEWKDVKVDQTNNSAEYFVNSRLNWIIKDTDGYYYKMKFLEFYNIEVQVGYTTIEFQRL
jgi:hypothetical protein